MTVPELLAALAARIEDPRYTWFWIEENKRFWLHIRGQNNASAIFLAPLEKAQPSSPLRYKLFIEGVPVFVDEADIPSLNALGAAVRRAAIERGLARFAKTIAEETKE